MKPRKLDYMIFHLIFAIFLALNLITIKFEDIIKLEKFSCEVGIIYNTNKKAISISKRLE